MVTTRLKYSRNLKGGNLIAGAHMTEEKEEESLALDTKVAYLANPFLSNANEMSETLSYGYRIMFLIQASI
jgi:hypothetical protein